jgi:hypothetical protein
MRFNRLQLTSRLMPCSLWLSLARLCANVRCEIFVTNAIQFNAYPSANPNVRRLEVSSRVFFDQRRLKALLRSYPHGNVTIVMVIIREHHEHFLVCEERRLAVRELFCWCRVAPRRFCEHGADVRHRYRALFPVGYPDVFHLNRVLQEPSALRMIAVEPIDDPALISENLLQISDRKQLHLRCTALVRK